MVRLKRLWRWITKRVIIPNVVLGIMLMAGGTIVTLGLYPQFGASLGAFLGLIVVSAVTSFGLVAAVRQAVERVRQVSPLEETAPRIHVSPTHGLSYLSQLPPSPDDFVGRTQEIQSLLNATRKSGLGIVGIFGMGGIGKTTLAHRFIELRADAYPNGQISIDMMGLSSDPLTPENAVTEILRAHNPTMPSPETPQQMMSLYISTLRGRREIILLDNVAGQHQVERIIPPPNCLLVLTSRQHFVLPGMHRIQLESLPAREAESLIHLISPRTQGIERDLAIVCAFHPLAIRLGASAIAVDESLEPSEYIERLRKTKERLSLVEATFELSINLLGAELQARWRSLAVFPGDFNREAAEAVMALGKESTPHALSSFIRLSILEFNPVSKRFRLHDLFREFADDRLKGLPRSLARWRHATYFMESAQAAAEEFRAGGERSIDALRRIDLEWHNITAARRSMADLADEFEDLLTVGASTYGVLAHILMIRLPPGELVEWAEQCLAFAKRSGASNVIRANLTYLGNALLQNGQIYDASAAHRKALAISKQINDRAGIAMSLGGIGAAYMEEETINAAVYYLSHSVRLAKELGDKEGEGHGYRNLGAALLKGANFAQADEPLRIGLEIAEELDDIVGIAYSLNSLGLMYALQKEDQTALDYFEKSLELKTQLGDLSGQINTLVNIAQLLGRQGKDETAMEKLIKAKEIAISIASPDLARLEKLEHVVSGEEPMPDPSKTADVL